MTDRPVDLWSADDPAAWRGALDAYPAVIAAQGVARLAERDAWYRVELPAALASREPVSVTLDELVRIVEWKMARGVWRARNLALVRSNAEEQVAATSQAALAAIPHPTAPIATLARLAGVGPATASAVAAAAAPAHYPFFDEIVGAQVPGLGRLDFNMKYYVAYAAALRARADRLGPEWTATDVERALWSHAGGKATVSVR